MLTSWQLTGKPSNISAANEHLLLPGDITDNSSSVSMSRTSHVCLPHNSNSSGQELCTVNTTNNNNKYIHHRRLTFTRSNFVIPFQMRTRTLWLLTMIWGSTLTGECWTIPWSHQLYSPSFLWVTWDMRKPLPVPNMLLRSRVQYWLLAATMSSANPLPLFLFLPARARQPRL